MVCELMPPSAAFGHDNDVTSSSPSKHADGSKQDPSISDGFLVIAKGLGIRSVLTSFLKIHADKRNLVFLINTSAKELGSLKEDVMATAVELGREKDENAELIVDPQYFHIINNETSGPERASIYVSGGLVAVTSRILVVDMLNGTVPMHLVTGILVNHAHKVTESSTEAFILRLLRDSNKAAFIKAFSDCPELLATGIWKLEKTMKILFLRKVFFWPRPMTDRMRIQNAIIQCIDASLAELKRSNRTIDPDDLTVENALFKSFDVILKSQLDPFWHKIGRKTKQVISDLGTLRRLLTYVGSYDCVTFYSFLDTIRAANTPNAASALRPDFIQSPWLMLDAADTVFSQAKARVFRKREEKDVVLDEDKIEWMPPTLMPVLEEQPKWKILIDVMREIEAERRSLSSSGFQDIGPVLIMVESDRTCRQIQQVLEDADMMIVKPEQQEYDAMATPKPNAKRKAGAQGGLKFSSEGSKLLLQRLLFNYLRWKGRMPKMNRNLQNDSKGANGGGRGQTSAQNSRSYKAERGRGGTTAHIRRRARGGGVSRSEALGDPENGTSFEDEAAELEAFVTSEMDKEDKEDRSEFSYPSKMFEFMETFEVLDRATVVIRPYAMSSSTMAGASSTSGEDDSRILEILKPRWIIMYDPTCISWYTITIEEQRYLSFIRKEKKAVYQDGRVDIDPEEQFWRNLDTRVAGGQKVPASESRLVIVDVREFRSALPSLLHARSSRFRKSLPDLMGSLRSGRLYNQVEAMCLHYKTPILLIEFAQGKAFSLGVDALANVNSTGTDATEVSNKLSLLVLAFPKLKIIWSSSPAATAEIFEDLKKDQPEPNMEVAMTIGVDSQETSRVFGVLRLR
ncbi:hypothetical protein BC829DRAFT_426126 [Chytridium lagenaria]|nr:hypothetical protein BC829DRAFT_426126 [Chytridium lagenaria]